MGLFNKMAVAASGGSDIIKSQIALSTDKLTEEKRTEWVDTTSDEIAKLWWNKFESGRLEHKNDLGEVTIAALLNEMEAEALDQLSYVREIKRRLNLK